MILYIARNCHWEDHGCPDVFTDLETAKQHSNVVYVVELNVVGTKNRHWSASNTQRYDPKKNQWVDNPRDQWAWEYYEWP